MASPVTVAATCYGWYSADNITGVADGGTVATWSDQSGNAVTLTGTALTYKVSQLNGLPSVLFNGTTSVAKNTTTTSRTQPNTIFCVSRQTATSAATRTMVNAYSTAATAVTNALYLNASGQISQYAGSAVSSTLAPAAATAHLYESYYNGTSSTVRFDNGNASTLSPGTSSWLGGCVLGANAATAAEWWNGDIFEVLLYNGTLSAAERLSVYNYLYNKWFVPPMRRVGKFIF